MVRPVRVLAIGWFGERNLGDEAMLEGLLADLRRAFGDVELTVMSADPSATSAALPVRAIPLPPLDRAGYRNPAMLRAFWRADLVTLGGGDLVREARGAVAPARFWLRRIRVARALRRPTVAIGISVGELRDRAVVAEATDRLRRLSLIAVRDRESAERIVALGLPAPHLTGDLALDAGGAAPDRSHTPRGSVVRIGVITRELVGRPGLERDAGERLHTALAAALDGLVQAGGASVQLVPFRVRPQPGLRDDDIAAGETLAVRAATGSTWTRSPAPESATAFGRIAADLDLIVSVRLHGLVLGAAAGVPVVGFAYDPKVAGFLRDLGAADQCLPLGADAGTIRAAIDRTMADTELPARLARGVAAARARTAAFLPHLAALVPDHRRSPALGGDAVREEPGEAGAPR